MGLPLDKLGVGRGEVGNDFTSRIWKGEYMNEGIVLAEQPAVSEGSTRTELSDQFGRTLTYLRVALTDRCNFRCQYCMPASGMKFFAQEHLLTHDEWTRIIGIFANLRIRKIRITGGEPLLYPKLPELISAIRKEGEIEDISVTTNGARLGPLAQTLKDAGLARANVSLDSLQSDRFTKITRGGNLDKTLAGIFEAKRAGLDPIKVNCVVMRGENDDELADFCRFSAESGIEVRFLEMMPTLNTTGGKHSFVSVSEMLRELMMSQIELMRLPDAPGETATQYQMIPGGSIIGFIGAVTRKFCGTCNRLRILPSGYLKLCLHAEGGIDLKSLMRNGTTDDELRQKIIGAVWNKASGSEFDDKRYEKSTTIMSQVGG